MIQRIHIAIRGAVQGVGFRPFVYRLADEMKLPGWVLNSPQGVFIEAEGEKQALDVFLLRLEKERPPNAVIQSLEFSFLDPINFRGFEIRRSSPDGSRSTLVLPDIATCKECLDDVFDPSNRRYLYPFTNCTNCGPRFTIIEALPYDRANTTMRKFEMCPACRGEYENPADRRFHAQPNACPDCGPQLELWGPGGTAVARGVEALCAAADTIRKGRILALKGLGGFHLMADARDQDAVIRLRNRKHREEKPFALMYPSLDAIRDDCAVSSLEARLLAAPESPIVLLERLPADKASTSRIAEQVAPKNPYLGVMLPYTPLHHLMMRELGFPVVATSGNLSEEPICTDEIEAQERLRGIADLWLVHDRPIARHVDDSIARIVLGRELLLRRARGYAPLPLELPRAAPAILAVGGHLKNTVALAVGNNVFISQHIGDLENQESSDAFQKVIQSFRTLYQSDPIHVVADMHPDYLSTKFAQGTGLRLTSVQHHYAHIASCMADNGLEEPVLGVSWDGTGYGLDGSIWGGEFLLADLRSFSRVATFRNFRLPGGSQAIREPRRAALGLLYEIFGEGLFELEGVRPLMAFAAHEIPVIRQMLRGGVNAPQTSSAGRLFDAVAALAGLRQVAIFEGQAAMELEFAIENDKDRETYSLELRDAEPILVDWEGMIRRILRDLAKGIPAGIISTRFHNALADVIVAVAEKTAQERVVLSGGCFQNKYLIERAVEGLRSAGFQPYWHQRVPPNDGGIALGQIAAAAHHLREK